MYLGLAMIFYAYVNLIAYVLEKVWKIVQVIKSPFAKKRMGNEMDGGWMKGRRFQTDFQPLSDESTKYRNTVVEGQKQQAGGGAGVGGGKGRMLRFFALFTAIFTSINAHTA